MVPRLATVLVICGFVVVGDASPALTQPENHPARGLSSGVRTEAALATPNCDPLTGRLRFESRYRPPCVRSWTAGQDNDGATASGVSNTAIRVAVLVPATEDVGVLPFPGLPVNQATRQRGTFADAARDADAVFDQGGFETWGRRVEFLFVTASGSDVAAQRVDAAAVIAQRPFAVIVPLPSVPSGIGGPVFERAVAARDVVVIGYPSTREALDQSPYRWSVGTTDSWAQMYLTAEFVAKQLAGRRATRAGDPALRAATRVFGVVYPSGESGLEIARFRRAMRRFGPDHVRVVAEDYDPALVIDNPEALHHDVVPSIVSRLQSRGATTIVPFTDSGTTNSLMKAATNLGFAPEWVSTMSAGVLSASALRSWDQDQAGRLFGLQGTVVPVRNLPATQPMQGFQWYWGTSLGTSMSSLTASLELLRTGVHLAGPRLTAATFEDGLCQFGAVGGAADGTQTAMRAPCGAAGLPYDVHHGNGLDGSLGWWDPDATYDTSTGSSVGPGAWRFLHHGTRFRSGHIPRARQPFFDPSRAIVALEEPRARDALPGYPCDDCPRGRSAPPVVEPAATIDTAAPSAIATGLGQVLSEDFADPSVVRDGGVYFAYSTSGSRGIVQVARSTDLASWTWSGSALTTLPVWATGRSVWAPSVIRLGGRLVMHYTVRDRASGQMCLSFATASSANQVFVDTSTAPFLCQTDRGGSIDPQAFVGRDSVPYLLWKSQAEGGGASVLLGARLTADGTALVPDTTRTLLTRGSPWEGDVIENPAMVVGTDGYSLIYSGNTFDTDRYGVGVARCAGPLGPCTRVADTPALGSAGAMLGPGGAVPVDGPDGSGYLAFHAWTAPRLGYRVGGARSLFVRPLSSIGIAPGGN